MLYQVRFQYGYILDADSQREAFRKARAKLQENPESAISKIDPYGTPKGKPGLIKRIITGK